MSGNGFTYAFHEAVGSLRRQRSTAALSIISIALALFMVALSLSGSRALSHLVHLTRAQAAVTAYLKQSASSQSVRAALSALRDTSGVDHVSEVSAATALRQMRVTLGTNASVLKSLGNTNPFTGYLTIEVQPDAAGHVVAIAKTQPAIALVQDNQTVIKRLDAVNRTAHWIGFGLVAIAGLVALIIVSHVVRLSMIARRKEIATLHLMGASRQFIALPFVLEGLLAGGAGSLLAGLILGGVLRSLRPLGAASLPFLPLPSWSALWLAPALITFGLGIVFGLVGSLIASAYRSSRYVE